MPTLEVQDYEHFSYDDAPLSLDEAIKKASDLRKKDAENFFRVEPASEDNTSFKVTKIRAASVYADFLARMVKMMARRSSLRTIHK
jgi:hypothetical protein